MRAGDGLWAIGDVTGVLLLTYVGKHQGRIAAANILGGDRRASYDAVPHVVFTDPQAASGRPKRHGNRPAVEGGRPHVDLHACAPSATTS